jgi:hypothetical protein
MIVRRVYHYAALVVVTSTAFWRIQREAMLGGLEHLAICLVNCWSGSTMSISNEACLVITERRSDIT